MDDSEEEQKGPGPGETPTAGKFLSGKQWFTIAMVLLAAIVTGAINIAVREYYQPDVRYEEGTWYYSGARGIVSLRIKNYGSADAEKIVFAAAFENTVSNASVNDATVACSFDEQKDPKTITGRIERLVPKQAALAYFDVDRGFVGTVFKEGPFVRNMTYNGGIGKTGEPLLGKAVLLIGFSLVTTGLSVACAYRLLRWDMRRRDFGGQPLF